MRKFYNFMLINLLCFCFSANAQQVFHHTNIAGPNFILNPGMTAIGETMEFGARYRSQWIGYEQAPQNSLAFSSFPFIDYNMGIGMYLMSDQLGILKNNEIGVSYSYQLDLGYDAQLSIGLMGRIGEQRLDGTGIITTRSNDPLLINETQSGISTNFGAGLFFTTSKGFFLKDENAFFIGIGSNQLVNRLVNFKDTTFIEQRVHANAVIGNLFVYDFLSVMPSVWIDYASPNILIAQASILIEMEESFWGGLSYHTDNTFLMQTGVWVKSLGDGLLGLGIMAGFNLGQNASDRGLSYEFLLRYTYDLGG